MEQGSFTNLPQEIAIDIFSRLPFPTIINCNCVCKAWRHLLSTSEFVDYHYSKSVPGIILSKGEFSRRYKILEFVDPPDSGRRPCKTVSRFSVPHHNVTLHCSTDGLLLFLKYENDCRNVLVCNPLTREYIILPPPTESSPAFRYPHYGFGVSKVSGEYKVVRVSTHPSYKFDVYTLGTGSWRSLALGGDGNALPYRPGVFVDGKLYSWVNDTSIACFDLETEVFSTVSCPSSLGYEWHLCALGGRLCLCLNDVEEVVVWVMNEVGHWRKEFVIAMHDRYRMHTFSAIKVLGDEEMLLVHVQLGALYYYSKNRKRKTLKPIGVTKNRRYMYRVGYTPSFFPLKTCAIENVCSF